MAASWQEFKSSEEYLTISEAERAGYMSRSTLYRLIKSGEIVTYRTGNERSAQKIKRSDLEAYLAPRPTNL